MNAQLLVLSGNEIKEIESLLPYMTYDEKLVIADYYPELMGEVISAIVGGVAAITTGIVGAVAAKKKQKRDAAAREAAQKREAAIRETEITAAMALENAKKRRTYFIMGTVGIIGIAGFIILSKKKKKRTTGKG